MTFYELVAREAYPAFFAPVVPFEREAVRIHGWELGSIPGCPDRGLCAVAIAPVGRKTATAAIDKLVTAGWTARSSWTGEQAPAVWYVIDEGALRPRSERPAGDGRPA